MGEACTRHNRKSSVLQELHDIIVSASPIGAPAAA
jgi:hypothetical protein